MTEPLEKYDIVICGAGLAGLTLALQLRRQLPEKSILILEKEVGPIPAGIHKVGESMTEGGTFLLRQLAGLKDYIESTHIKKLGLRFFGGGYRKEGFEKRFEIGDVIFARNTSYQLDRGVLENDLRQFCRAAGVHIAEGVSVTDIELGDKSHAVTYVNSADRKSAKVTCRWVVDAMGRRRFLQSKLGLGKKSEHEASSSWWRVQGDFDVAGMVPRDAADWHERVFARRWYSTNHLLGPGYFIWIIPLCSNMTSIGIVTDEATHPIQNRNTYEKSLAWLAENEPDLYEFVKDEKALDFLVLKRFAYKTTKAFSTEGWCSIGEAAAFTDPLYSMGTDLIAIGNRITTHLIELDDANCLTVEVVESYNKLYVKVVDVMTGLFHDMYPSFGADDVMILKIMWDIACYWGFFSQLSIQDFLSKDDFQAPLLELATRLEAANIRAQCALRAAANSDRGSALKTGFYNFGGVSRVTDLRAKVTEGKSIEDIAANIAFLEQFAQALSSFVSSGEHDAATSDELRPLLEKLSAYLTPVENVGIRL